MHCNHGEHSCRNIIEHDSGAFREFLQLPHRRRFEDVEPSEKYKTREKSLPRERDGDQSDELSGDLVDDDELRVFSSRGAGYASGRWDAD